MARVNARISATDIVFDHSEGSPADYLHGSIDIAGKPFHVIAVRVVERSNDQGVPLDASDMAQDWWYIMQEMDAGFKQTVRIPKMQGDWVIVVTPFTE
jgi:hypothetical protein